jgi:hypothetical protein
MNFLEAVDRPAVHAFNLDPEHVGFHLIEILAAVEDPPIAHKAPHNPKHR